MVVKTHPPMNVLYSTFRTTLATLHDKVGTVARDLHAEAARQHILVTGPVYWFYYGSSADPNIEFTLEIAVPVSGQPVTSGDFLYQQLPAFQCFSHMHEGSWSAFGGTYATMFGEFYKQGLKPAGVIREMYLNIDFSRDEANLTEIQIGIATE